MSLPVLTVVSQNCGCVLTLDDNVLNMMHEIPSSSVAEVEVLELEVLEVVLEVEVRRRAEVSSLKVFQCVILLTTRSQEPGLCSSPGGPFSI